MGNCKKKLKLCSTKLGIAQLCVGILMCFLGLGIYFFTPKPVMPNVLGWEEDDARKLLENIGLEVSVEYGESEEAEQGQVFYQSLEEGLVLEKGMVLCIKVNSDTGNGEQSGDRIEPLQKENGDAEGSATEHPAPTAEIPVSPRPTDELQPSPSAQASPTLEPSRENLDQPGEGNGLEVKAKEA